MSTRQLFQKFMGMAIILMMLTGCSGAPAGAQPTTAALPNSVPPTAVAAPGTATITGRVHLVAPPTPHMVVYALDTTSRKWAFAETQATDGEATFSLVVPEGSYQVFAFSDMGGYAGYSVDGATLGYVSVGANQTISDINVAPPGQSACGSMFGLPASPEGRFAAIPGPTAECIASAQTQEAGSGGALIYVDTVRIQFNPGETSQRSPGDLEPNMVRTFVLGAQEGQTMTVELTTEPASDTTFYASLYIRGADGTVLTPDITTRWSGVLPTSQDYYIEVRSMTQQSILYSLYEEISAVSTSAGSYGPVSESVCKTIQELATNSIALSFSMEMGAPFADPITGEKGTGCTLTAMATGMVLSDSESVTGNLINGMLGFTELPNYRASGPTGSLAAMSRDMGLLLIEVAWMPSPEVSCPADQPISSCEMTPEQKLYTVQIRVAQK